jgi:signal transduction histidine kinase
MKLITKTILFFLLISLPLLVIACVYSYKMINAEVKDGTDEALYREKLNLQNLIKELDKPRNLYLRSDSLTSIVILPEKNAVNAFSDTVIYDKLEEENLRYRLYRAYFFYNGTHYLISCTKPTLEEDELKEGLIDSFILVFGFLLLSFFVVTILLSKTLWKPFYKTIEQLNKYDINNEAPVVFDKASTKEFKRLNEALSRMTEKIFSDYRRQKEFTENASHELQTPLAVIKTKLDLLIQSKKLGEEELEFLQGMENSVQKISSLNKALLLLTKIENKQFKEHKAVNLKAVIEKVTENYSDLFQEKKVTLTSVLNENVVVDMNPALADLLISNLMQNAYRHNKENGSIEIELNNHKLIVSNTGEPLQIKPEELFVRFKKNDASKESLGLGLSIVKSIAIVSGYKIEYTYSGGKHNFIVIFGD